MNTIPHNLIADMAGPSFLLFFLIAAVITIVGCRLWLRSADSSIALPPIPLPPNPDPLETAFLKGGHNEVTRVAIFSLIQRGHLEFFQPPKTLGLFKKATQIRRAAKGPNSRLLTPIEKTVFHHFSEPRTARQIFQSPNLPASVQMACIDYEKNLQREHLLASDELKSRSWTACGLGVLVLVLLAGYKLAVAIAKGRHNFGFLIALGILSVIVLLLVCRPPRVTKRGKSYLDRLQNSFQQLKGSSNCDDTTMLILVALFGATVLQGTAFADYHDMFRQTSTGGCGGGCGGGGCGGGGCGGGGCGGCGGGD